MQANTRLTGLHATRLGASQQPTFALQVALAGHVQGVGLRPAVAALAERLALAGWVKNTAQGALVHVEGPRSLVERFALLLDGAIPAAGRVDHRHQALVECQDLNAFEIVASDDSGPVSVHTPRDRVVCQACMAEVLDPANRRSGYPFTSCTACGPRYSIIKSAPFDRARTSMDRFEMCATCHAEYTRTTDIRFHAQTIACRACGPQLWLENERGATVGRGAIALELAVIALRDGKIVAVRGLGGYQLLADATDEEAVTRLRQRKRRPTKPLAVLVRSLAMAEELTLLDASERELLACAAGPIVVAQLRDTRVLAKSVSQRFGTLGLFLPTTPLHALLSEAFGGPLVATSGNHGSAPLAVDPMEARRRLADAADLWLHHDRPIERPVDDSVVHVIAGRSVTLRLARGMAPWPLSLKSRRPVLALGGHQKAAVALNNGAQAILGPHIGELDDADTRERFDQQCRALVDLYRTNPEAIAHDLHPDYYTTRLAERLSRGPRGGKSIPMVAVQHHHAHIAAGMLEHGWLDRQVLGIAWDGAGYGDDATVWGGECLLATARDYRRVATLWPFLLVGGDAAVRQPWRVAVALVREAADADVAARLPFAKTMVELPRVVELAGNRRLSPTTTSVGRLFDGVAALALGVERASFEGEPAMLLEAACDWAAGGAYQMPLVDGALARLDWRPMIRQILDDLAAGVPASTIAMRFHRALADCTIALATKYAVQPVVLGGGVFQNCVLVESIAERWLPSLGPLGLPGAIPPSDGGLAAGQLAVALARLDDEASRCA